MTYITSALLVDGLVGPVIRVGQYLGTVLG